ncbi:preprotein translocase subunit SecG [Solimonas aquatica]|uniref:Protein-export membrane protein SecG n=1 Tax=Solimonas aquatica TaxID=489703 RepID=A0A1H9I3B9_9GAMM|nr:preprotein translocase subunit SecG [Solimonas aquatica]SEQ68992.1 preprotein translocase subunit SecG [Solimonas aquatica]
MYTILVIVEVLVAVGLVGLILLQHGKGADAGAAFGSGASGTVFGARGSANFLSRATGALATVFFIVSLALAYLVHGQRDASEGSVVDRLQQAPAAQTAAPAPAAATAPTPESAPAAGEQPKAPVVPE